MISQAYLVVNVSTGNGNININNANIVISNDQGFIIEAKSGYNGKSEEIALNTPLIDSNGIRYGDYFVSVFKEGFIPIEKANIKLYENSKSFLPLSLQPISSIPINNNKEIIQAVQSTTDIPRRTQRIAFREPYIPTDITVHLGSPNTNAENITVPFVYYIKNVASSEIYPTWPIEALRANIAAIISLALNRIYTEWYPSRGFNFQITNNTQYDQKFIKDRNIFDSISEVVDEVFNTYIQKGNNLEPYFSSYCDGRQVTCAGMSQWGSYDLANQGLNALEILRYYYGDDIQLVSTNNIQDIEYSYPGRALRRGDTSPDVYIMQYYLNRIAIDYPNIYKIYPANGVFSLLMEQSVKNFQRQFNLEPDGIIGKATWYKINYIYLSVTKLAQLESEGIKLGVDQIAYAGTPLRLGSRGEEVSKLQYLLSSIAFFYSSIIAPSSIDGDFGTSTLRSVESFQAYFSLPVDGIVGETTWNAIKEVFLAVFQILPNIETAIPYPNQQLSIGSSGEYVTIIQTYLNYIAAFYSSIDAVEVDGIFGQATKKQVEQYQRLFSLPVTGVVNSATWNSIGDVYTLISAIVLYPGNPIKLGDSNRYVAYLQIYLNDIASVNNFVAPFAIDGIFGNKTLDAVKKFQTKYNLTSDGIVGEDTWNTLIDVYLSEVRNIAEIDLYNKQINSDQFPYQANSR